MIQIIKDKKSERLFRIYTEFKLFLLTVILLFFVIFPLFLPVRFSLPASTIWAVGLLIIWLITAVIFFLLHQFRKSSLAVRPLKLLNILSDILFLSLLLSVFSSINSHFFFFYAFVILGAAFYLDLVLIITAGFLSTLILIIGFFIETSSPITLESGFLLLAHIIFLAVVTYFVYLFTLSYIEVLWQKKKIRRISQVNKELLINTTNQLRAPLPVIRDFIGYLLLGHAGDINQKQMKILALLRRNTEQLIEEAGTAVYFNQIKRHELYISKVRTDLTELLKSEVQKSLADAQSKGLRIELNAPRSLLVNLDQNKIMHVIDSLIENAIIFSNRRARLKIKAEKDRAGQFVSIDFHYINIDIPNFAPHEIVSSKKILLNDDISIQNLLIDTYVAEKIIEKHRGSLKVAKDSKNNSFIFSIVLPAE